MLSVRADLAVVTFLYGGNRANTYGPEHVHALKRMLDAHLTVPHRFVCVSDREIPGIEVYPMWEFPRMWVRPGFPDCWRRLGLYKHAPRIATRILMLDLDILIRRNIDHLASDLAPYCILKGSASKYGGAMQMWESDKYQHVYDEFDPVESLKLIGEHRAPSGKSLLGSDQTWLSVAVPDARTWFEEDGVWRYNRVKGAPMGDEVCVVNHGGMPKYWHMPKRGPGQWVREEYMGYLG